jgi:PAS domain S-box-containing protein
VSTVDRASSAAGAESSTRDAHILIVDDEAPFRDAMSAILAAEGYESSTAASGADALMSIAARPPDLILTDVTMPGIDGFELAERLKTDPVTTHIPIIFITAARDQVSRLLGLSAGAEMFLSKPIDPAELSMRIRNLLRLKHYGDHYSEYSRMLAIDVASRTAELEARTEALERQAALLTEQATLLDLATDGIFVQDIDLRVLFWSRGAAQMYGWTSEEMVGWVSTERMHTAASEPVAAFVSTLLREGRWEGEVTHRTKSGARICVACRSTVQVDSAGTPIRILTIATDVTGRRHAEHLVERALEDQLRFKDEFLSHVSHELRSPLTAIKQFTSILLGGLAGPLTPEQQDYQQIVLRNVRQLQAMIDDLLEVTRLETGKLTVELESVSVVEAITDSVDTLRGTFDAAGVALTIDLPSDLARDLPSACADPIRLRQVLIILLENAVKFTTAGGAVSIRARRADDDSTRLRLTVSDTGAGVSAEIAARLFDRLYQAPDATQSSRKGLGLGLFIARELMTRQNGRIDYAPSPGGGSTFALTLPVFSLDSLLAPFLQAAEWPAPEVAVIMVDAAQALTPATTVASEEWLRDVRRVLATSILPDLDVLLPTAARAPGRARFAIAAFTDAVGATGLANRVRAQCQRLLTDGHGGRTLNVSCTMLPSDPRDAGTTPETMVTRMASRLERLIVTSVHPVHP